MQVTPCVLLAVLWIVSFPKCSSLSQDGLALLNLKSRTQADPHGIFLKWKDKDETPCHWPGVSCVNGLVKNVNLTNQLINGSLAPELGQITTLQNLLLGGNSLHGTIPKQLGSLQELKVLDLGGNKLEGNIPPEIGNASKLNKLYLHNNSLQGNIPSELGYLHMLYELRLDRNKLVGTIPNDYSSVQKQPLDNTTHIQSLARGLCSLNNLTVGNFSYNYLSGPIPSCLHLPSVSFKWNCFGSGFSNQRPIWQCGESKSFRFPHHILPQDNRQQRPQRTKHLQSAIAAGVFVSLLVFVIVFFRYRHGAASVTPWKTNSSQKNFITVVPAISQAELEIACEDFSNIIGSSPDSVVFKGTLSNGAEIAVTKIQASAASWSLDSEICFRYKVDTLARISHKHLVKLLGYCSEDEPFTRMLVFEYTPNGTLFDLLHNGDAEQLDWNARMRIIMGVAYGLEYMHHSLIPPASYSKFDSSSVYLTEDYAAKLADIEIGKPSLFKSHRSKSSMGGSAVSYDDLEDFGRDYHDFKADIYGFGVLLLELISGKPSYCKETGSLIDWASPFLNTPEMIAYMVDPVLRFFDYNQLESLCDITRQCISTDSSSPNMRMITNMLETALGITSEVACPKPSPLLWAELAILTQM